MLKAIPVSQLRVGMFVSDRNADWIPNNNKTKSGLILRQEIVDKIKARGVEYITIDTARGIDVEDVLPDHTKPEKTAANTGQTHATPDKAPLTPEQRSVYAQQEQSGVASPSVPLVDERAKAEKIHQEALSLLSDVMAKVQAGTAIEIEQVEEIADDIVASVYRNENALACMSRIRDKDAYLMEHSLNVGILLSILGKSMGFDQGSIRKLAVGGMLHDVGKIQVPDKVLHKPGKLEADEWEEMKRHVVYGEQYLTGLAIDPDVVSICAQHHERLDGTGYPNALQESDISLFGRMAAVCDVYDAITADRVYHQGMTPSVAMKRLVEWSDHHLDRKLVYQFIRAMSIYPIGTTVELNSGQLAIVVTPNKIRQAEPVVRIIYSLKHKRFIEVEDVDLAKPNQDIEIVRAIDPARLSFDLHIMDFM